MKCVVVLVFALLAVTLVGRAVAQSSIEHQDAEQDAAQYAEQDDVKTIAESEEEPRCVPSKTCGPEEEYRCCGPCYQFTCRGSVINCPSRCYADCYCVKGFVREFPGGRCIPNLFCKQSPLPILADYEDSV